MLRLKSGLIRDGFKQKIPDSLCILVGSWICLGLRSPQLVFPSVLSGLLKNNGPAFLPHAVSLILWGLAQAPGDEPLPVALLELMLGSHGPVASQHPGLRRLPGAWAQPGFEQRGWCEASELPKVPL